MFFNRFTGSDAPLYHPEPGEVQVKTFPATVLSTSLQNLQKYTNYSIQILSSTRIGEGAISDSFFCHTREDGNYLAL